MNKRQNKNISNGVKIAVSSTEKHFNGKVSDVFARCPYFVIAEIENEKIQIVETIENKSANQLGQAGISAAQLMAEKNVNTVITKNMGPRALDVLKQFNIAIYYGDGAIKEVLQEFINGELKKLQ